jgi:hypothetical protein
MNWMVGALAIALFAAGLASVFLKAPASRIASGVRVALLAAAILLGCVLLLAGRVAAGAAVLFFAAGYALRSRPVWMTGASGRKSTVRSAMVEMQLDLDTGDMDGVVLTGPLEGRALSGLAREELLALHAACRDEESLQLLEAYLDRRLAGWREHADANAGARAGGAARAGAMTKQEAYEVLGLAPGADAQQVREAHRRLMKRVHPDRGGSNFLAARINEAKALLLD